MSIINKQLSLLADSVRLQTGVTGPLTLDGMTNAIETHLGVEIPKLDETEGGPTVRTMTNLANAVRALGGIEKTLKLEDMIITVDEKNGIGHLAYEVNDDKKTCNITGIGTYNSTDLVIPSELLGREVYTVDSYAFQNKNLTSVVIQNGVKELRSHVFAGCDGITEIFIPESVNFSYSGPLSSLKNLKTLVVAENNPYLYSAGNCVILKKNGAIIAGCQTSTIPKDSFIKSIGVYAFLGQSNLKEIVIPKNISQIGSGAFSKCSGLTEITIPESVSHIGLSAFSECSSVEKIEVAENNLNYSSMGNCLIEKNTKVLIAGCKNSHIPIGGEVQIIGENAFQGQISLTSIEIPEGVTSIESAAFSGCESLTSVTISDSVTAIGMAAFQYCPGLTEIVVPNSVTSIESSTFSGCWNLTSVTISDSVITIGDDAFRGCTSLTSIVIPDSVTFIGERAFFICIKMADIKFNGTVSQWNAITKGVNWNQNVPATYVQCSDGQVAL